LSIRWNDEKGNLFKIGCIANQAIDIHTFRATSVAQIKARLAGNGLSLVKSRNAEQEHA
jgi:hypothetical protein